MERQGRRASYRMDCFQVRILGAYVPGAWKGVLVQTVSVCMATMQE